MEQTEMAKKMLQAIRDEYKEGKMPEEVYRILVERWGGVPEEIVEEAVEEEIPEKPLPPCAGPEDMETLVLGLLKNTKELEGEIIELEVERETVEGTLKGLEKKMSAGVIEKSRFAKLSRQYALKIKEIDTRIVKKRGQIESIRKQLGRVKTEIQKKIDAYVRALRRVEKAIKT